MSWDGLFELLAAPVGDGFFNQYRQDDLVLDHPGGSAVRLRNLACYLEAFAGARIVLVGEAAGYAGCRFSGIPFTSERQLVGPQRLGWTRDRRLGCSSTRPEPWAERSAAVVWGALGERRDCLLWNAFPWHPHRPGLPLSNRSPGRDLPGGLDALRWLLAHLPAARPVAVGRVAERSLASLGVKAPYVRHPARGGKAGFVAGLARHACEHQDRSPGQPTRAGSL